MSEPINKKEKLLLEYTLADAEVFALCYTILKPEYFEAPLDRVVEFVQEYFVKYGGLPDVDIIDAEVDVLLKKRTLDDSELDYFLIEVEEHCQEAAMTNAVLMSADLIAEGKRKAIDELIKEAYLVKLDTHLGTDLFLNIKERIDAMSQNVIEYSTGITEIDTMIGKYRKGELHMCYAVSSGGKSLWLGFEAIHLAKQQLDVAVITLELNEQLYAKRLDAMISKIDIKNHASNAENIEVELLKAKKNMGDITIKFMHNGSSVADIEAWLLEYRLTHGKLPDVLIVDYLHLMGVESSKGLNRFDIDDELSKGLRRIATRNDLICLSAQQLNRSGQDLLKVNASHAAGGISVINNSDSAIFFAASEEDLDNNQVHVGAMKIRNAEKTAKATILYRCPKTLRFSTSPFIGQKKFESPLTKKKEDDKVNLSSRDKLKNALKMRS